MKFKVKLELKEIVELKLTLYFKESIKFVVTLLCLVIGFEVIGTLTPDIFNIDSYLIDQIIHILLLLFMAISIFFKTKKIKAFNQYLSQNISYEIDEKNLNIIGESFETTIPWAHLTKIKETKNWFMIYIDKSQAFFIPKNRLDGLQNINEFRNYFPISKPLENAKKIKLAKIAGMFLMLVSATLMFIIILSIFFGINGKDYEGMTLFTTLLGSAAFLVMFLKLFIYGQNLDKKYRS